MAKRNKRDKQNIFISNDGLIIPDSVTVGPGTDVSWIHEDGDRKFSIRFLTKHPFEWKTKSKKGPPVKGRIQGVWGGKGEFKYEVGVTNPRVIISGPELIVDGGRELPRKATKATRKR